MVKRWCFKAGWNVLVGDCDSHAPLHSFLRSQTRFFSYYLFFLTPPSLPPHAETRAECKCITSDLSGRRGGQRSVPAHTYTLLPSAISLFLVGIHPPCETTVTPRALPSRSLWSNLTFLLLKSLRLSLSSLTFCSAGRLPHLHFTSSCLVLKPC